MKPKLLSMIRRKEITKKTFLGDITSGIIVAIIALPLSVALAISSGVSPEKGLITAIIAGFFISLLGGSKVQIGGPTGAFVVIVYGIVQDYGLNGLIIATIMAGIIMIVFGFLKFGSIIKYVPQPITIGFTMGIAITLLSTQIKDFFGLKIENVPSEFIEKWSAYISNISTLSIQTIIIGVITVVLIVLLPKVSKVIPGSLVALIVTTVLVQVLNLDVSTIGDNFENLSSTIPPPVFPSIDFEIMKSLIAPAVTIAILASLESLLSAAVADGITGDKHDSNMELVAQGIGNIFSGLFGGIPATGAIARTAANIKNGGKSPISGITHSVVLLIIMLLLMPAAKLIPMTTLAGILIVVSYNMGNWKVLKVLFKAPKSDIIVFLITLTLTVIFDLVIAIEVGMVMAVFLFMKRAVDTTDIELKEENRVNSESEKKDRVLVYEIKGPFFFGIVQKFLDTIDDVNKEYDVLILDFRRTNVMDSSGLDAIERLNEICIKKDVKLKIVNIQNQPKRALEKMGFMELVSYEDSYIK